jgi:hypothetical protein
MFEAKAGEGDTRQASTQDVVDQELRPDNTIASQRYIQLNTLRRRV